MNIQPLGKKVAVKKILIEDGFDEKTGLFMINRSQKDDRHVVVALGPKCVQPILPGSIVIIPPTVEAVIVKHDGDVIKFVHEDSIVGIEE